MKKEIVYLLIGVVLGGIVVYLIFQNGIMNQGSTRNINMSSVNKSNVLDAHFIEQMVPHHEDAITMAKIALTKSEHQEIKTLAENIITSQSKEIEQMKQWYKDWYGKDLPSDKNVMTHHGMMEDSGMHMGLMGGQNDVTALENAENFDKSFIEGMIPHHQMAVMMANMLQDGTDRDEMKKLATDIISAQTKEINQMREWYSKWGY